MSEHTTVYDLGNVEFNARRGNAAVADARTVIHRVAATPRPGFDPAGTFSLFVPGTGQMLHGEYAHGLLLLSAMGFLGALGWALLETLDRVVETLRLLGYPGAPGAWALGMVYLLAVLVHLGSIVTADPYAGAGRSIHPAVSGVASAILPGWGQVLNGSPRRAALFVASLWAVVAVWLLALPEVQTQIDALGLYLPEFVSRITTPAVRWTAPAVIWALAVYDAASTAASRR